MIWALRTHPKGPFAKDLDRAARAKSPVPFIVISAQLACDPRTPSRPPERPNTGQHSRKSLHPCATEACPSLLGPLLKRLLHVPRVWRDSQTPRPLREAPRELQIDSFGAAKRLTAQRDASHARLCSAWLAAALRSRQRPRRTARLRAAHLTQAARQDKSRCLWWLCLSSKASTHAILEAIRRS